MMVSSLWWSPRSLLRTTLLAENGGYRAPSIWLLTRQLKDDITEMDHFVTTTSISFYFSTIFKENLLGKRLRSEILIYFPLSISVFLWQHCRNISLEFLKGGTGFILSEGATGLEVSHSQLRLSVIYQLAERRQLSWQGKGYQNSIEGTSRVDRLMCCKILIRWFQKPWFWWKWPGIFAFSLKSKSSVAVWRLSWPVWV